MENCELERTLLNTYKYFEPMADKIDALIEKEGTASFYTSSQSVIQNSCEKVAERMIDLMEHKKNIINLKILTEKALKNLSDYDYTFLTQRFFENIRVEDIAQMLGINCRTAFRRLDSALDNFKTNLHRLVREDKLQMMANFEPWISKVLQNAKSISLSR